MTSTAKTLHSAWGQPRQRAVQRRLPGGEDRPKYVFLIHLGSHVVDGGGMGNSVVHFELIGPDPARLRAFYSQMFGWDAPPGAPVAERKTGLVRELLSRCWMLEVHPVAPRCTVSEGH